MRLLKFLLLIIIAIYVAVCVAACAMQDQFAFYPDDRPASLSANVAAEMISVTTEDGESLVAFYAKAQPGCPTFLNFHGNAQHLSGLTSVTHSYGKRGMGFLAIAYRGYSGSTGRPTEKGVRKDGRAAYAYLIEQGIAPDQIVLRGFSLGSSVAIGVAAESEASALILGAPFESGMRLGAEMMPLLPVNLLASGAFRSDRFAPDIEEPVLIIHGDSDRIIPADHSLSLVEHFPSTPQRVVLEGYGHNDLLNAEFERLVIEFVAPRFPNCPSLQELVQ